MIKQSSKPKRGHAYLLNGNQVWLYLIRSPNTYIVCDSQQFEPGANYTPINPESLVEAREIRQGINTKPKKPTDKEKTATQLLNDFFDEMANRMPFNCENCGKPLYANTKWWKRCCTAHILPKSDFPEVETNPDNIIFLGSSLLGICTCHNTFDQSIEKRKSMKVYKTALKRFRKFEHLLDDPKLIKAHKYLGIDEN